MTCPSSHPRIPEPFATALANHTEDKVVDARAEAPGARYGRAMARARAGRTEDARCDLEIAHRHLGDVAAIEIAFLDYRAYRPMPELQATAETILQRCPQPSFIAGRALHLLGLTHYQLRASDRAIDSLRQAIETLRACGQPAFAAQAEDSLGTVFTTLGKIDTGIDHYTRSLAAKSTAGDRLGMAITLGNMGRAHLRAKRFDAALTCLRQDEKLMRDAAPSDLRTLAGIRNDIGRVLMSTGDAPAAKDALEDVLTLADQCGDDTRAFYAHKDLALLRVQTRELDAAKFHLEEAAKLCPPRPFLQAVLDAAQSQWERSVGSPAGTRSAVARLRRAVETFAELDLPDHEIPARIELAEVLSELGDSEAARQALHKARQRIPSDGGINKATLEHVATRLSRDEGSGRTR